MSLYELERRGDVQELVRVVRDSDNERIRARAATLLGEFGDHDDRQDVVDALVEAAQDGDSEVAGAAVDALDHLGGDAQERLIATMAGIDPDGTGANWLKAKAFARALEADVPELRMAAANALGKLEESKALGKLLNRFSDEDPRVRARAARACGKIADPRAVEYLADLLADDVTDVRREAAEALGKVGTNTALNALVPLTQDENRRVRQIAVDALGNFDTDRPVEHLTTALADPASTVRRTAVYSIVELLGNVPTERNHDVREAVLSELSELEDRTVVVPFVEILEQSSQPAQRRNTAWLVSRIDPGDHQDRVIDGLVSALEDGTQGVSQIAATSLTELEDEAVERRLLELVREDTADPEVRAQAIFALGSVGGQESRRTLDSLIEETDNETLRKRALSAISKLGGRP